MTLTTCPPRWATKRNESRQTYGRTAASIARKLGWTLMPWQRQVLDVSLEINPATGKLAYRNVMVTIPRQGGKSTLMLVVMLTRCVGWADRQRIVYTAQDGRSASEKFEEDYVETLRNTRGLTEGRDFEARLGNGKERILWLKNRSLIRPSATTPRSGHGKTLDLAVIDEAFAHTDLRLDQSFGPPMLTRPEPQLWVTSTAGTWQSLYFNSKRTAGRQAVEEGNPNDTFAYFEWSADDDDDLWDRDVWRRTHPALGHTITEEALEAEIRKMLADPELGEAEARRAYLNQTRGLKEMPAEIPPALWSAAYDAHSTIGPDAEAALAIDMTPNRARLALCVAGWRADGLAHLGLLDERPDSTWLIDRLDEIRTLRRFVGVALDPSGPAGALAGDLERAGWAVIKITPQRHAQACGALLDRLKGQGVKHLNQPELAQSVAIARRKASSGAWIWDRENRDGPVSAIISATFALGALLTTMPTPVEEPSVYDERGMIDLDEWS